MGKQILTGIGNLRAAQVAGPAAQRRPQMVRTASLADNAGRSNGVSLGKTNRSNTLMKQSMNTGGSMNIFKGIIDFISKLFRPAARPAANFA